MRYIYQKNIMKTILVIIGLFTLTTLSAQNKATLLISQDARLAILGDDIGNDAFTTNVRVASEWQGNQLKHGFFFGRPEIEYADLKVPFVRTSLNFGFNHNMFSDYFNIAYSVGYGIIYRKQDRGWLAANQFNADLYFFVNVTNKISIFVNGQVVNRNDLKETKLVYSNFVGIKFEL